MLTFLAEAVTTTEAGVGAGILLALQAGIQLILKKLDKNAKASEQRAEDARTERDVRQRDNAARDFRNAVMDRIGSSAGVMGDSTKDLKLEFQNCERWRGEERKRWMNFLVEWKGLVDQTRTLFELHSKEVDGIPIWYFRPTLEKAVDRLAEAATKQAGTISRTQALIESLTKSTDRNADMYARLLEATNRIELRMEQGAR